MPFANHRVDVLKLAALGAKLHTKSVVPASDASIAPQRLFFAKTTGAIARYTARVNCSARITLASVNVTERNASGIVR